MKKLSALICVLLVVLLTACAPASTPNKGISSTPPTIPKAPGAAPAPQILIGRQAESVAPSPPMEITVDQQAVADRMIVRTGNMALVVDDVSIAIEQITAMAGRFKGNIVSSNVWQDRERLFGNISFRVPAGRFDEAMAALRALAVDVTSETTNSQDVTEEYTDLGSQLKNLQATEQQLLTILAKAETVKDILDVQRELSNTRGQIEQTKGRMQYLERTSASSLIQVSLQQSKLSLDFNANKTVVKEGEPTFFNPDISGGFAPYSYEWNFGDKSTSTEPGLNHAYKNDGKYSVTLTVTDDHVNKITKTRTDYITVLSGWSAGNIVSSAWNGLVGFGHALANIIIWMAIFSPVWIAAILIFFWLRRRIRRTH